MTRCPSISSAGPRRRHHEHRRRPFAPPRLAPPPPRAARSGNHIDGRVAECAPLPLECAGIGIEHDHAAVPVAVRDEGFVGLGPHEDVRRLMHGLRVGVALADASPADLQQKLPLVVELEEHVVVKIPQRRCDRSAAADPHVVLVVDGDAMFAVRPVVAWAGAAPRVDEFSRMRRTPAPAAPRGSADPRESCSAGAACRRDRGDPQPPMQRDPRPSRSAASAMPGPLRKRGLDCVVCRLRLRAIVRKRRHRRHYGELPTRRPAVERLIAPWTRLVLRIVVVPADVQPEDVGRDLD